MANNISENPAPSRADIARPTGALLAGVAMPTALASFAVAPHPPR